MIKTDRLTREQQQLVVDNRRLAASIAMRASRCTVVDLDDLVGWGYLGLVEAALRFDPARGFRFSTYAVWWIRNFIYGAIRDANGVKASKNRAAAFWRLWSEESSEDVAARCELSTSEVDEMRARICKGVKRLDSIEAQHVAILDASPEQQAIDGELRVKVWEAIAAQSPRTQRCLVRRFVHDETLDVVATGIGRSRERVRQIEMKALRKIGKRRAIKELAP